MTRKPFKPRTWWTVFHGDEPMWQYTNAIKEDAVIEFLKAAGFDSLDGAAKYGYTVGKIVVTAADGN